MHKKHLTTSNIYSKLWNLSKLETEENFYNMIKHPQPYSNHEKTMRQTKTRPLSKIPDQISKKLELSKPKKVWGNGYVSLDSFGL